MLTNRYYYTKKAFNTLITHNTNTLINNNNIYINNIIIDY